MSERNSSLGYMALIKEVTKGVALTPDDYVPLYDESFVTNAKYQGQSPILGNVFTRFQILRGQRDHQGDITIMAEPNTMSKIVDMLLTKGSPTGSDPYTHPFTLDGATDPASYTVDISVGHQVFRYMGVQASELTPVYEDNEMRATVKLSALAAFNIAEVASVAGAESPWTITLATDYDAAPTNGLVVADTMQLRKASDGSTIDFEVASVENGTDITTTTDISTLTAGDLIYLVPATPSLTLKAPFLWSRTEFRFGADAAAALSAAHTPVEKGSNWKLMYPFENDEGSDRSGSFDPASLVRSPEGGDIEVNTKIFYDDPLDFDKHNQLTKRALVIRHFSETGFELRITCNNMRIIEGVKPAVTSGEILYAEQVYQLAYDTSDGQGFDVKVINGLATI